MSGKKPGEFVFSEGVLTKAAKEGAWVVFEDVDTCPDEILTSLSGLMFANNENGDGIEGDGRHLQLTAKTRVRAHADFRLFGTVTTKQKEQQEVDDECESSENPNANANEDEKQKTKKANAVGVVPAVYHFDEPVPSLVRDWMRIQVPAATRGEVVRIVTAKFGLDAALAERMTACFFDLLLRVDDPKALAGSA